MAEQWWANDKPAPAADSSENFWANDKPADAKPAEAGFIPTIKRTAGQMLTTAATTADDVIGPNAVTKAVRETGQGIIDRNPAGITKLGDVVDSPWLAVKEAVGQFAPQIGAATAGGFAGARAGSALGALAGPGGAAAGAAIGGVAGSLLPIFTQEYGGIRQEQKEAGQEDKGRALAAAIPATALERVGMGKALNVLKGVPVGASSVLKEAGKGVLKEGATEGAQNVIEQWGAFKDPTTGENLQDTALSAVMGGIGGGVAGGAGGAVDLSRQSAQKPADAQADTQPPTAEQVPGLGFNPNAGTHTVFPDGSVVLNSDTPTGEQAVFDKRYAPQPIKPSEAMGLDPSAGPMSAVAVMAVDGGAHQTEIDKQNQALAQSTQAQSAIENIAPEIQLADIADPYEREHYLSFFDSADKNKGLAAIQANRYLETVLSNDNDIPDFDAASTMSDEDFLRFMGADEQEITNALAQSPTSTPTGTPSAFVNEANVAGDTGQGIGEVQSGQSGQGQVSGQPVDISALPATSSGAGRTDASPSMESGMGSGAEDVRAVGAGRAADQQNGGVVSPANGAATGAVIEGQANVQKPSTRTQAEPQTQAAGDEAPADAGTQPAQPPQGVSTAGSAGVEAIGVGDARLTKALDRIAKGTAYFGTGLKATKFIADNGLKGTHEVVKHESGANRWDVRAKKIETTKPTGASIEPQANQAQPQQTQQQEAPAGAVAGAASEVTGRPTNWRGNFLQAAKVARDLKLDPKGKKLAALVAEIETHDAAQNTATTQSKRAAAAIENVAVDSQSAVETAAADLPVPAPKADADVGSATKGIGDRTVESVAHEIQKKVASNRRKYREKSRKEREAKGYAPNSTPESEQTDYDAEISETPGADKQKTAAALLGNDPVPLIGMFVNGNFEASEEVFKEMTGVRIRGLSAKDKKAALYKWAKWTPDQIAQAEQIAADKQTARANKLKEDDLKSEVMGAWLALGKLQVGETKISGTETGQEFVTRTIASGFDKAHSQKKGVATIYGLTNGKNFTTLKSGALTKFVKSVIAFGGLDKAMEYVNPPKPQAPSGIQGQDTGLTEFTHNGTRIYPVKMAGRNGAPPADRWAVESSDNKARRESGDRNRGGDTLHTTIEEAKKAADFEATQDQQKKTHLQEIAATEKAEKDAADAKREANKGKSLTEIKAQEYLAKEILDGETGQLLPRGEWVKKLIDGGAKPSIEMVNKIKPLSRALYNRASNQEQSAHEKKIRDGGKVPEYSIGNFIVSKTEHDFAQSLATEGLSTPTQQDVLDQQARAEAASKADTKAATDAENKAKAEPTGKIEDSGAVLEGARKLYAKAYADKLDEGMAMDTATVPLSKSWPEPDYQRMLDDGADPWAVAFARSARDEVPNKPGTAWKLKGWAEKVKVLRELAAMALDGKHPKDMLKEKGAAFHLMDWFNKVDLYEAVGHAESLKGVKFSAGQYGMYAGQTFKPAKTLWTINVPSTSAVGNWGHDLVIAETKSEAIEKYKVLRAAQGDKAPASAKVTTFDIYTYRSKPGFIVGKRISASKSIDLKTFDTLKEAREYKSGNQVELEQMLKDAKFEPAERRDANAPRVGVDHRSGADVTTEQFRDTFGFRGEQFGASMPQGERQSNLNQTYDALMDLAGVVGIPPKALSLNGELGLAFGARGHGGKNPAAAHYEPDTTGAVTPNRVVINLTRKNGAGSLAHEWFHAVDNYFARMQGQQGGMMTERIVQDDGVRPEMRDAFRALMKSINLTAMKERSKNLDKTRSKDYWSTGLEMAARSFESYVIAKLQDQSASNDYLANIVSDQDFARENSYPYPTAGELPQIRAAFEHFFDTVQTKSDEAGNVAMFSRSPKPNQTDTPAFKAWFGDSKVVDADGKPLVVYHGSKSRGIAQFKTAAVNTASTKRLGAHFTASPEFASTYGKSTTSAFLSIKNPLDITGMDAKDAIEALPVSSRLKQELRAAFRGTDYSQYGLLETAVREDLRGLLESAGHDGVRYTEGYADAFIVFEPEQIKSATGNNGNFEPTNPDIRFSHSAKTDLYADRGPSQEDIRKTDELFRAARPKKSTIQDVRKAVNQLVNGLGMLPNKLGRIVVATSEEIESDWVPLIGPVDIKSESEGDAQGFYSPKTRTVFLIADHINQGDEMGVVAHELMHKHGQDVLGKAGWDKLHETIEGWKSADAASMERQVYDEAASRVKASGAHLSNQELFPYAVQVALEMGVKPNAMAQEGTVARWLAGVRQALRQAWDKITNKPDQFKAQDMVNLAFGIAQIETPDHAPAMQRALDRQNAGAKQAGQRGTNEPVTNPKYVVGKSQDGRSADDLTPGDFQRAKDTVDGLNVRDGIPNRASIGAELDDHTILPGVREVPFSAFTQMGDLTYYSVSEEKRTKQLAERIKESGEINPLIVVIDKEGPYILEGGHRFDALREIGKTSFPALVVLDNESLDEPTAPDSGDASFAGSNKSKQGTTADRAVMDMVREGRTAQDILQLIAGTSRSRFNKQVARLLLKTGVAPAVEMGGDLGGGGGFKFLAKYSPSEDVVTMTDGAQGQAEQIFLHEMVHAATIQALNRKGLASVQMRKLFEHVKKQGGAAGQYGMKNVREFASEAFTNPDFQRALKTMNAPSGSSFKTSWDGFVRIMRGILGLPQDSTNALSRALDLGVAVMQEDKALRERGAVRRGDQARGAVAEDEDANFGEAVREKLEQRGEHTPGKTSRQYTPEQLAAMKSVGLSVETPSLKDRAQALWKDAGKKLAQGIADQFAPVRDLDKDAYTLLRLSKGASGAFEALLHGGQLKLTDNVYDFNEAKRGGVIDTLLKPLQGEHHDFLRWVAANRAERLKMEGKENLFTPSDITALKSLADGQSVFDYTVKNGIRKGQVTRNRAEIYRDSLVTFNSFQNNILDMAEQSGLIDGEARQLWEHEFYVPFYRVEDDGSVAGADIKSSAVRQMAFKSLTGRENKLNADLLDNTLMNWAHLLDASAKNRAAKATLEAAEKMGVAIHAPEATARDMARDAGNKSGVVWFRENGEKRFSFVDDPYVLTALTSLEYAGMRNPAMNAMSAFKHALTLGVTASPYFKIRNLIRDSVQVIASGPIGYNPVANVAQGWKLTDPKSDAYFRLLAGGGTIHFGTMMEGSEGRRVQSLVDSGVAQASILDSDEKVKAFYRKFIKPSITAYNELGDRGEAINRAALYDQLVKQGVSHAEASIQARDLMDFSMQGSFTSVRFLTQVVPFMNARIQGLYKLGKAAKEDPKRFAAVLGATAMFSLALLAAYSDDDDWKKREEWDRNNFWWFKFGGTAFRIPKPFEIGAIGTLAERGFELAFDKEMTNKRFMNQVMTLLGDNLSMNPVPQLVKPVIDMYANKDSFSGRPIETMGMEKLQPEYRFTNRTSMVARGVSTAANAVTGMVGVNAPSPVQVDHLLRSYFGWLGSFVVGAADVLARPATDQPGNAAPDYWKTATGSIASSLDGASSRYVSQMYDQAKEIEQAYGTWRALLKEGKTDEAQSFMEANKTEISKHKFIERVKKSAALLNQQIKHIERSDMPGDEKREKIIRLREQQDRVARQVS